MRKTTILILGLLALALSSLKALLKDRFDPDQDEIDVAAVASVRRIEMRARPFIGATMLVAASAVELDLRRVLPAPTGLEISVLMYGGSLRVVIPPDWGITTSINTRLARLSQPAGSVAEDAPVMRLKGSAWLSNIVITRRPVPAPTHIVA
jgi:hypothetical protein